MSVLLRAADVPATSRVEYWRHVVGDTLGVLDVRADGVDAGDRLPNAAHLSRAFREAYGTAPVEYRAMQDPTVPAPLEPPAADGRLRPG